MTFVLPITSSSSEEEDGTAVSVFPLDLSVSGFLRLAFLRARRSASSLRCLRYLHTLTREVPYSVHMSVENKCPQMAQYIDSTYCLYGKINYRSHNYKGLVIHSVYSFDISCSYFFKCSSIILFTKPEMGTSGAVTARKRLIWE